MNTCRPSVPPHRCFPRPVLLLLIGFPFLALLRATDTPAASTRPNLGDLSLEQLLDIPVETVFSASKFEQKITRAPASVTIVTAGDIAAFGQRTLGDLLRSVRGIYVADDGNYSYLGARGFLRPGDYSTRVLVLIDGHRINDNVYDSAYYGREGMIDPDTVDRVEVIRGPSSSIYGSSAFLGVINVVTKQGGEIDGAEIASELGSFGSYKERLTFGRRFASGLELFLSASRFHSDGQSSLYYPAFDPRTSTEPRAAHDGIASHADAEDAFSFNGNATYGEFTFSAAFSTRTKTIPTASYLTIFNTDLERTTDRHGYADLQFHHEIDPALSFLARAFYDSYSYDGTYPYADAPSADQTRLGYLNRDSTLGESVGTEWQLTAKLADRHTVIAGFEFRENLHQRQTAYDDLVPRHYLLRDDHSSRTGALYTQGEFALAPHLLLNAGLRYDQYFGSFGGTLNPRLGLIYNPQERTTLKALFGRAFRAPNAYERFYYTNPPSDHLEPETIRTYELALEHYFTHRHRLGVSLYRYQINDLISQVADSAGNVYFANLNRATATGLEVELESKYASGVRTRASWALQDSEDSVTGETLTNSPRQLAKLGLVCPLRSEQFTAALELQYQSSVRTLAHATAGGFLVTNLTLARRQLGERLDIALSVFNLFDTRYGYPGAEEHAQDLLPQPGRTLNLKLTCRF